MKVLVMEQVDESHTVHRRAQSAGVIGVCAATEEAALAFAKANFGNPVRCDCEHIVFDLLDKDGNSLGWFLAGTEYEVAMPDERPDGAEDCPDCGGLGFTL